MGEFTSVHPLCEFLSEIKIIKKVKLSESRKYIPTPSDRRSASPPHFVERGLLRTVVSRSLPLYISEASEGIYSPTRADRILSQSYRVHYVFLRFKFTHFELNPMDR